MFTEFFFSPRILFALALFFIFAKIYEHNLVINLIYEKQRLAKTNKLLLASKNRLLARYLSLKNYKTIHAKARDMWGMKPMDVDHVVTLTTHATTSFFPIAHQQSSQNPQDAHLSVTLNSGG